jgi:diguanylate cyclase (GGDEF)-like protein/PAS domain S-box-containing protein
VDERVPEALLRANLELARCLEREGQWRRVAESLPAAEQRRRSSELLERLFDSVHFLLAYMDPQFNFIRVNRAYAAADGRPAEFFIGRNHFELYPHAENERIFHRAVESGEPHTEFERPFEYPEHPERGITWWDWTVQPVKGAGGEVEGVVLLLVDVTEKTLARRRLEALVVDLRRRAVLMERAEDLGQLGYWQDDLRTHEVTWSEGVFRLVGIGAEERFSYGDFERFVERQDWPLLQRIFADAVAGRIETGETEVRLRRADTHEERVVAVRGEVERDESGAPSYLFWVVKDVTAARQQAQLEELAAHDPLTGAANRRALERFMDRELRRESRHGHSLAVIMFDVDAFKSYNDLYGHQKGDDCLRMITRAIQSRLRRPGDLLVRYGGEEFLVVLPETELGAARQLAEEMRTAVAGAGLVHTGSPGGGRVTVSAGVAAARARLGGFEALMGDADTALYRAKARGRNRVETTPE